MISDMDLPVKIMVRPTVRGKDGLALSSRNRKLSPSGRKAARVLFLALTKGRDTIRAGGKSAIKIRGLMTRMVKKEKRIQLDYAAVAEPGTLKALNRIRGLTILLIAAKVGKTRLIDNIIVQP